MDALMLTQYDALPPGLLDLPAARLGEVLPGPTLIHLPGRRTPPLFVSVLLHGNEDTGWLAAQSVLKKYATTELPRALSLFIGNIDAARCGLRRLDGQPDYNRVWPGSEETQPVELAMMQQVVDAMRARGVFASIDIHNNTGLNPHYACVNRLEQDFLHLATLFSRIVVYFIRPLGVQSAAFAELCPAVTLECGKPGTPGSIEHAADFMEACLHLSGSRCIRSRRTISTCFIPWPRSRCRKQSVLGLPPPARTSTSCPNWITSIPRDGARHALGPDTAGQFSPTAGAG
jgi:succinylglutamate desuccinylase